MQLGHQFRWVSVIGILLLCVSAALGQSSDNQGSAESERKNWGLLPPGEDPQNRVGWPLIDHIAKDQIQFWTTPFHTSKKDAVTKVLPFMAFTSALMVGDTWISNQVPDSPSSISRSKSVSNYAVFGLVGGAAGMYFWGNLTHNEHQRETGFLAGEAAIDSTLVAYAFKEVTRRERPYEGNGAFFHPGGSSFPSEHSAVAWSVASVVAHEYPGWLTQALAYGAATGVSLTRVTGKQHFPSDVVVGSALGWFMGRQIYRAHHDPELGGAAWGSEEPAFDREKEPRDPSKMSSPYVALDSWIYPALERLQAAGYLQSGFLGQRPWTRMECARLLEDARDRMAIDWSISDVNGRIFQALEKEFASEAGRQRDGAENLEASLDSVYTRVIGISGPPLTDSYNFGQTIINDYGRPYQEGTNIVTGASGHVDAGPFSFYVRAEYQHAPSGPGLPDLARGAIAGQSQVPVLPYTPFGAVDRFRLIEGYVSANLNNVQFSFGKQALWWGPGESGPMVWSTNAESIPMLRIATVSPVRLPSILKFLGPMQTQFFIGQLDGQQFVLGNSGVAGPNLRTQPFVHGQKISFRPTSNLEFGFSRTVVFGGDGHPFTIGNFWNSYSSLGDSASGALNIRNDPGDRRSGFDVTYRVPKLRDWLTVYLDSFCDDDVLPLANPVRCAWNPGFYLPQIPHLPRLDFRAEGITTDSDFGSATGVNYSNVIYRSGYTNDANIIGNWIGRQGRGLQLWSTYTISPKSHVQAMYRLKEVDPQFLQGGRVSDIALNGDVNVGGGVQLTAGTQFERWYFPLLASTAKNNVAVSVGLTYRPNWKWIRK